MYAPLSLHTHYSLLRGYSKPKEIAKFAANLSIPAIAITDFDSMSGSVSFVTEMNKVGIKPVLGTKVFLSDQNGYVTLLAMNHKGWQECISISSKSYLNVDRPSVTFADIVDAKNVVVMSGEPESTVVSCLLSKSIAYTSKNPQDYTSYFFNENHKDKLQSLLQLYKSTFGDRFRITLSLVNRNVCPVDVLVVEMLRDAALTLGIKSVAVPNSYYLTKQDKLNQNLLLASGDKTCWTDLIDSVESEKHASMYRFIHDYTCHLPDPKEFESPEIGYTESEIKESLNIIDMCENYSILGPTTIPNFECPNGMTQKEYLLKLCRDGWARRKNKLDLTRAKEYGDRVNEELGVFTDVGLEGYFLIVQDYVNYARKQGMLVGAGRGSVGGCLLSYLLGITGIDPIKYDLYFERFYNKGRNEPGKVSFPDIDVDFPVNGRPKILEYIKNKYGHDNVTQVATFSRLQGRGAIREVLRIHKVLDMQGISAISKLLPDESEIADKLEEEKETSIIRWVLRNDPSSLEEWCTMDDDDKLSGPMSRYFSQAIEIEGTYKSYGKHASAVIVGNKPIIQTAPMLRDKKTGELIAGIEFEELELMGTTKLDVLGCAAIDKLMAANELLRTGRISNTNLVIERDENE